jgi:predicted dehydrogenase
MRKHLNRRGFLHATASAGLSATLASQVVARAIPEPIRLGVIGVGNRGTHLLRLALNAGADVRALCDIRRDHLQRACEIVKSERGEEPEGYSRGPRDYLRLLEREDIDAVICGTDMQEHAAICIAAMRAEKDVLSEVAACMTLEECWDLVRAYEETHRIYMLAENCCYWPHLLMVQRMIENGLFGAITYAECGYVHDCRSLAFDDKGELTWRGRMARDFRGNLYPTHDLGPLARWIGINRGDRLVSLTAMESRSDSIERFVRQRFPAGHPARGLRFQLADSTNVLIRTAKGVLIQQRFDMYSARPAAGPYHALQGVLASYDSRLESIWIEGRSKPNAWDAQQQYAQEFEHPKWSQLADQAKGSGHGGADFFVVHEFLEAVRHGRPSPIDVYDAVTWSSIIPLSGRSISAHSTPQEIPDFTSGKWKTMSD